MPFWSKTTAAPRWIDTWFGDRTSRFLRLKPPAEPKTPEGLSSPVRLTIDDVGTLSAFWTASYGGDDWYMDAQPAWVSVYLKDPSVIVLGAFDSGGKTSGYDCERTVFGLRYRIFYGGDATPGRRAGD